MLLMGLMIVGICGCSSSGTSTAKKTVSTQSGALTVDEFSMKGYTTAAQDGDETILAAKEGEGFGVGNYIVVDGANAGGKEDTTWTMRCPSYVAGQEYTFDQLKNDITTQNKYRTYEEVTVAGMKMLKETETTSVYYYGTSKAPFLIQVVGTDVLDAEAVDAFINSLKVAY